MPGLGLVVGAVGQPEVPCAVVRPQVLLEVGVLRLGVRLHVAPVAVEDLLLRVDQPAGVGDGVAADGVGGHAASLSCSVDGRRCDRGTRSRVHHKLLAHLPAADDDDVRPCPDRRVGTAARRLTQRRVGARSATHSTWWIIWNKRTALQESSEAQQLAER